jgi:GT2 family glycosyltransferase
MAAEAARHGRDLSVSIVVFRQDLEELSRTIGSLRTAVDRARAGGVLGDMALWIVDNGGNDTTALDGTVRAAMDGGAAGAIHTISGHGNVGYGQGHNLALIRASSAYHLVLNPDVVLDPGSLLAGLRHLEANPDVGMVTPWAEDEGGQRQYLCKRYPSVGLLALRGFAPGWLRRAFRGSLEHYEMRDLPENVPSAPIPIASGCFMLCRRDALAGIGGFSPDYFLYFEDFDLSLRLGRRATIAHVPAVRIRHSGGNAADKGWAHRRMFARSGLTFFRRHGWRLL